MAASNDLTGRIQTTLSSVRTESNSRKWEELTLPRPADDAVSAAIMRITYGNLRVLDRIVAEIKRLQKINCFQMITPDIVEVARKGLLLGTP